MDRVDLDLREDPQEAWRQFAAAATPEEFYRSWLAVQCGLISGAASAVVVLRQSDEGPFGPVAFWPGRGRVSKALADVAERALSERRGLVVPIRAEPGGGRGGYGVAYPVEAGGRLRGCVALEIAPRSEDELQAVLQQLQWGASGVEVTLLRDELAGAAAGRDRLQRALDLVASAFGREKFFAAATAFVTAVATQLGCDRVSVGFVRRGRGRVHAVSHTAEFGKQTNLARALEAAMDEAIDQGETIVYPPPPDAKPQITRAQAELQRLHGAGAVCAVPLAEGGRIFGALLVERPTDRPFDRALVDLCEAVAALGGPVLDLKRRDDRWLPAKAADSGRALLTRLVGPGHLTLKLSAAVAAALAVFFVFAQGDFRVPATTVLEPVVRQALVAPFNGYVAEAPARAGDLVRRGQVLAALDDRELRLDRLKWLAQYEQYARQHAQAMAARNAAQVVILAAQMDQARAELALRDDQLQRTRIQAPFDGVVVTGDLSQSLASPVERGQVLFEVAPLDAYRLVLHVDERDIAEVALGQRGSLLLSGAPHDPLPFTVQKITPVSAAKEGHNVFRVEARLDQGLDRLRPGMEGVGKIEIGRRVLIWIWTRQVIDWVRLTLWTWLP